MDRLVLEYSPQQNATRAIVWWSIRVLLVALVLVAVAYLVDRTYAMWKDRIMVVNARKSTQVLFETDPAKIAKLANQSGYAIANGYAYEGKNGVVTLYQDDRVVNGDTYFVTVTMTLAKVGASLVSAMPAAGSEPSAAAMRAFAALSRAPSNVNSGKRPSVIVRLVPSDWRR